MLTELLRGMKDNTNATVGGLECFTSAAPETVLSFLSFCKCCNVRLCLISSGKKVDQVKEVS